MRFQETNDPGTVLELDSKACYPVAHGTVTKYLADGGVLRPAAPSPDHDWDDGTEIWVLNQGRADEALRIQDIQTDIDNSVLKGVTLDEAKAYIDANVSDLGTAKVLKKMAAVIIKMLG